MIRYNYYVVQDFPGALCSAYVTVFNGDFTVELESYKEQYGPFASHVEAADFISNELDTRDIIDAKGHCCVRIIMLEF